MILLFCYSNDNHRSHTIILNRFDGYTIYYFLFNLKYFLNIIKNPQFYLDLIKLHILHVNMSY